MQRTPLPVSRSMLAAIAATLVAVGAIQITDEPPVPSCTPSAEAR
jgi:hypothetical protein